MIGSRVAVAVAALTALGAALVLVQASGSLLGDELGTAYDVDRGFGGLLALLRDGSPVSDEYTPPGYFALAWLARRAIGALDGIRVPSMLAAAVLVPVVFALGRRAAGAQAGLLAAAVWALSPFAAFYGSEARPYALLALLSAGSTLLLLAALEHGGGRRWIAYALVVAGVLYTHYTGAGVVLAQATWALVFGTGRRRAVLLANAAAIALFLPWLPFVRRDGAVEIYQAIGARTLEGYLGEGGHAFPGHPFLPLADVPGTLPLVTLLLTALVAATWAALLGIRRGGARAALASPVGLVVVVALATPAALLVLGVASRGGALLARSLAASLPAAVVLLTCAASTLPRTAAVFASAVVLGVTALAAVQVAQPDRRRPDHAGLAAAVDRRAGPDDPVLVLTLYAPVTAPTRVLSVHYRRRHDERLLAIGDTSAWSDPGLTAAQVLAVVPTRTSVGYLSRPPGPPGRYRLVGRVAGGGLGQPELRVFRRKGG